MSFAWSLPIDLDIISAALLLATLLRARLRVLQRFLVPNALTAGFIALAFYNLVAAPLGLSTDGIKSVAYHLLSLSYIALCLRAPPPRKDKANRGVLGTSTAIISQFALQVLVELLLTSLFIATMMPDLFPSFGLLIPLGFAQGPGQALAIGSGWEEYGFVGAGDVGLTFAAIGFVWACAGGVLMLNIGVGKGWLPRSDINPESGRDPGVKPRGSKLDSGSKLTTSSEAIDSLTYHLALVMLTYLLTYLLLKGITYGLGFAGRMGHDLAVTLWG